MNATHPATPRPTLLCFGELLWDFLPDGLFPGGAPFNVAYHLHQHGLDARIVTAVGRDILGEEFLRRIRAWGLPTDTITEHAEFPTGYGRIELSPTGEASYRFANNTAWDHIHVNEAALRAAAAARGLVFGSLALRSPANRSTLDQVLAALPADAWRIFDVNLRPPHDDLPLVNSLAPQATLIKLNAAEAGRLARGGPESPGHEEADARALAARWSANSATEKTICLTCAERGAGLLHNGHWHFEAGRPVEVADTVGAGDSFLAALLTALLIEGKSPAAALAAAARIGEWVATQRGATPRYAAR
ncbi:hypothetical protein AXK12_03970 [Cephaloticoccus capnophilus]|uniref:Carbohydrate kinase PfkB domain-containing protein n=1 Tax=Cephaloticoccus capnophilus TaxID=1548208 RepID=A0A139SNX0_9BACT|nr:PfkB family carbohydrate kinase [Cephaloticoccus capnophilus]KXU36180.1 hypothetical protein AXK12_03970 [Cephaloticoccus capnophilus]